MTPSSSGQHLKRNGINTHPIKNSPDKIKNYKPPTRIKSKERQTAIQVDNGNLSRERHL
uniref:Small, acid-soluble spore protein N n=1 Tax=Meloidogyne hapla TaxID=6305 RepID=A0A1I8C0Q1_MELHA